MKYFKAKSALSKNKSKPKTYKKRIRNGSWSRRSKAYRKANPICELCKCKTAVETHHRKPLSEGGELLDWSNLQALCIDCHRAQHHGERED